MKFEKKFEKFFAFGFEKLCVIKYKKQNEYSIDIKFHNLKLFKLFT